MMSPRVEADCWEERRYNFSFAAIAPKLKFRQEKIDTWGEFAQRIGWAVAGSIAGHLLIFLLEGSWRKPKEAAAATAGGKLAKTLRGTEYSAILFTGKLLADRLCALQHWRASEYQLGGAVGLWAYLLNRPLDQLEAARREINLKEGKLISRAEALRVVLRYDGLRGLYRHENALAPLSAALHRSIFFGLQDRLHRNSDLPEPIRLLLFPLAASAGASAATFLPDKLRSLYLHIHHQRHTALARRGKTVALERVTKEVMDLVASGEVTITGSDMRTVGLAVLRNWVLLAVFCSAQRYGGQAVQGLLGDRKTAQ